MKIHPISKSNKVGVDQEYLSQIKERCREHIENTELCTDGCTDMTFPFKRADGFSLSEINAANTTISAIRKKHLIVDKRRETCYTPNVQILVARMNNGNIDY